MFCSHWHLDFYCRKKASVLRSGKTSLPCRKTLEINCTQNRAFSQNRFGQAMAYSNSLCVTAVSMFQSSVRSIVRARLSVLEISDWTSRPIRLKFQPLCLATAKFCILIGCTKNWRAVSPTDGRMRYDTTLTATQTKI